ncbi:MAG: aldolase catalytic domain-containing protein [Cyclobacteriaceae bacterium]|nr:aldolase catalytic domain-containing protein [Cyclobacteriaceae bacterium]
MNRTEYLDCTLRDGGYYTNWDFDKQLVNQYLNSVNVLPIDIIEVGYRSLPKKQYVGQYFYCPERTLEYVRKRADKKKIAIMLNEKEVPVKNVAALLKPVAGFIDLVRLAVQPERFDQAVLLAQEIKAMGVPVAFNLMYMSKVLQNKSVLEKLPFLNGVIDCFSLVDSYGGVYPEDVRVTVQEVCSVLSMPVGFHGHNNMELAFVNSLTALEMGCKIVDGTITGMGRGAGNLKTELFMTWLAQKKLANVDFNALSDVVDAFEKMQQVYGWGTNLPYMVSGANSLPQQDVMDWLTKRTYSMNSIIRALHNQTLGADDNIKLPVMNSDRKYKKALLVAGGQSAVEHAEAVLSWIDMNKDDLVVIHVSTRNSGNYTEAKAKQIFALVGNEGKRLEKSFNNFSGEIICVLPPYPRKMGTYIPEKLTNTAYELSKVDFTDQYTDSHTAVSLQCVIEFGAEECYAIGFDGYAGLQIGEKEQDLLRENDALFSEFIRKHFPISSLAPSKYDKLKVQSIYELVAR